MAKHNKKRNQRKQIRDKILIIADGETETNYIKGYIEDLTKLNDFFDVQYMSHEGNTKKILRKIRMTESTYLWIFAMSDMDCLSNKKETYNEFCNIPNIYGNVIGAFSNPSFEIWLWLHFHYHDAPITAKDLNKRVSSIVGKNYKTNPKLFARFSDLIDTANANSVKLLDFWKKPGNIAYADMNPSTYVQEIIAKLKQLDEEKANRN